MWVLIHDSRGYTVGYYTPSPDGRFYEHITLNNESEAESRVAFLNGGVYSTVVEEHLQNMS